MSPFMPPSSRYAVFRPENITPSPLAYTPSVPSPLNPRSIQKFTFDTSPSVLVPLPRNVVTSQGSRLRKRRRGGDKIKSRNISPIERYLWLKTEAFWRNHTRQQQKQQQQQRWLQALNGSRRSFSNSSSSENAPSAERSAEAAFTTMTTTTTAKCTRSPSSSSRNASSLPNTITEKLHEVPVEPLSIKSRLLKIAGLHTTMGNNNSNCDKDSCSGEGVFTCARSTTALPADEKAALSAAQTLEAGLRNEDDVSIPSRSTIALPPHQHGPNHWDWPRCLENNEKRDEEKEMSLRCHSLFRSYYHRRLLARRRPHRQMRPVRMLVVLLAAILLLVFLPAFASGAVSTSIASATAAAHGVYPESAAGDIVLSAIPYHVVHTDSSPDSLSPRFSHTSNQTSCRPDDSHMYACYIPYNDESHEVSA